MAAGGVRVVELLGSGIDALAHADAARLEVLAEAAQGARMPTTAEEWRMAEERRRTLGHLITLTRRNLRLLRGAGRGGYGPPGN